MTLGGIFRSVVDRFKSTKAMWTRQSKIIIWILISGVCAFSYNACSFGAFYAEESPLRLPSTDALLSSVPHVDSSLIQSGKNLYANNCATCHRELSNSSIRDKTVTDIKGAMARVLPMESLQGRFTDNQLLSIAAALASTTTGPDLACNMSEYPKNLTRRMNTREFLNSTRDLLGNHSLTANDFPATHHGAIGFDTDSEAIRTLGPDGEKVFTAAEKVVDEIMANTSSKFNSCNTSSSRASCVRTLLSQTAKKAFRRPANTVEIDGLVALAMAPSSAKDGVRNALVAIVASPSFLFHVMDYTTNVSGSTKELTPHELASKLSFLLWSTIPDDQLLGLADSGQLSDPATLKQQVSRMLADPRAGQFISNFPSQWLGIWPLSEEEVVRNATLYPEFNAALRNSMVTEARLLFNDVLTRNLPVSTLVTSEYTFVDRSLATLYGIQFPNTSDTFAKVALDGVNRRGLLTQAAYMTVTANGNVPNTIKRGVSVLRRIACEQIGDPKGNIPTFDSLPTNLSVRDRLAAHRNNPDCAFCHVKIDPMGLAFENFDGIGRYRRTYSNGSTIDPGGNTLDGGAFSSTGELLTWMGSTGRVNSCASKFLGGYALNRTPLPSERCHTDEIAKRARLTGGDSIKSLIETLVTSDYFKRSQLQ